MTTARCLTPEEYATERRVSLKTVYRLIKAHKMPAERVGRQWRIWLGAHSSGHTRPSTDSGSV
jgi:excisionase family DNA binding protein